MRRIIMLKVAASDYDGTLFRDDIITARDAEAIRRWRAAGHKFGVVSGRDHGMLMPQLKHYGVEYDYLACNNGGLISDDQDRVLWEARIEPAVLKAVSKLELVRKSFHFSFSSQDRTYLCHDLPGTWVWREAKEWDYPIVPITEDDIDHLPQTIHQYSLGFTNPDDALAASEQVNARFGDTVHAYPNRCAVDIIPSDISKQQAIAHTLSLFGWDSADILAIGDEINDLPMILGYNGYTVATARPAIQEQARKVYDSVGAMLEDNL